MIISDNIITHIQYSGIENKNIRCLSNKSRKKIKVYEALCIWTESSSNKLKIILLWLLYYTVIDIKIRNHLTFFRSIIV